MTYIDVHLGLLMNYGLLHTNPDYQLLLLIINIQGFC